MNDKALATTEENKPLALATESQSAQVMDALTKQIETGKLAPEQLGMMLDAQERILDRQASMDFAAAMASCQAEMPQILKTENNAQTQSKYESLDALNKVISPVYTRHGLSISFGTGDCPVPAGDEKGMWLRITAEVSHRGGYSKTFHYDLPYDIAGIKGSVNKTKIHASGSTLTYGRRYLLKLIFNLTTVDDLDDDGNAAGAESVELITGEQATTLHAKLTDNDLNMELFMKWLSKAFTGVESIDNIPAVFYDRVSKKIDQTIEQKNK